MKGFYDLCKILDNGCWQWLAGKTSAGYGVFYVEKHPVYSHRLAWTLANGEVPAGMVIDHLCRNRACCNVSHMEAVSRGENVLRGIGVSAFHKTKTHCKNGHEFTTANTRLARHGKNRQCKQCERDRYHNRCQRKGTK